MKKLFFVCIFLVSVFSLSIAEFVPMNDGTYVFKTIDDETIIFISKDNYLKLITQDGTRIPLTLVLDKDGNYFYYLKIQGDNNYIKVGFNNYCMAMIETSFDRFFLYNTHSICK